MRVGVTDTSFPIGGGSYPRRWPDISLDGVFPLVRRQPYGGLEPSVMHLVKQFLVGSRGSEAKDGIDAAIGAERRRVIIDPFRDPLEREFIKAVEASTNCRSLKR